MPERWHFAGNTVGKMANQGNEHVDIPVDSEGAAAGAGTACIANNIISIATTTTTNIIIVINIAIATAIRIAIAISPSPLPPPTPPPSPELSPAWPEMASEVGRPCDFRGDVSNIVGLFEKHLSARHPGPDHFLFDYDPEGGKPSMKLLKKELPLLLALGDLDHRWRFGGPFQVRALQRWNQGSNFFPRNGSRTWATSEIAKLWLSCGLKS